jgi:Na+/melibiose symporter-like transporter
LLSAFVIIAGYVIRREVAETPAFTEEGAHGAIPNSPIQQAFQLSGIDMLRVVCMALMNVIPVVAAIFGAAYAVQPAYGIGFSADVYLWIPVVGNILAVAIIPMVGRLSDRIGRRPPIIVGALGYNAVFPSFYPELFPTRVRVTAMAIAQNVGTTITALLPALFASIAPPGSDNIPLKVGAIAFGVTVIAAIAALSARETYRIHLNDLGQPDAAPVAKPEYDRLRARGLVGSS